MMQADNQRCLLPITAGAKGGNRVQSLASELGLEKENSGKGHGLHLEACAHELRLVGCLPGERKERVLPVRSNLERLTLPAKGRGHRSMPLYRAVLGRKRASGRMVLDATGGLGEDAWLLAQVGCSLVVVEQEGVVFALLRDGLARVGVCSQPAARRIRLVHARSQDVLRRIIAGSGHRETGLLLPRPHVVYLDPFFSSQRKQKGESRRSMRALRHIAGGRDFAGQAGELLDLGLQTALDRVVVKRPRVSEPLPSLYGRMAHSIKGRGHRFDVYHRRPK